MAARFPPGPSDGLFGILLIRRIRRDLLGFFHEAHRHYGDIVHMRLGPYHDYTVFHPALVKDVLVTQAKHFIRMPRIINVLKQWNGESLLIAEGDSWLRLRRLAQPAFQVARFEGYAKAMVDVAGRHMERWPTGTEIDFEPCITDLTIDVAGRTLFGTEFGSEAADISRAVRILAEVAVQEMMAAVVLPDWLPLPGKARKCWAKRTLDGFVRRIIAERQSLGTDAGDLLSMLLSAVDSENDQTSPTAEQVRDQCVTFFLAGHDTTAAGLTWLGWALASQPDVAARVAAEVADVVGDREPCFADTLRLKYTGRVVQETLRRYPPAAGLLTRQATCDVHLGDWVLPRGSLVRIMTYTLHHDPRWFLDPERFDPDRFAPGRMEQIPHGAYLPFGAGPRSCIGASFATMEMILMAALLVQRFDIKPAPGFVEPSLDVFMSSRPHGGMRLVLEARRAHPTFQPLAASRSQVPGSL